MLVGCATQHDSAFYCFTKQNPLTDCHSETTNKGAPLQPKYKMNVFPLARKLPFLHWSQVPDSETGAVSCQIRIGVLPMQLPA